MSLFGNVTYSQHGEDLFLLNIFHLLGIEKPSYLDIGCHHPTIDSNTALLYQRGSRGINIDANPLLIPQFDEQRPEDINLNIGIGANPGKATFYQVDDRSGLNSFSLKELHRINFVPQSTIEVQVVASDRTQ